MKHIVEASKTLSNTEFSWTQRKAYEMTFKELKSIDADDDDEGIQAIRDWVTEQIREKESPVVPSGAPTGGEVLSGERISSSERRVARDIDRRSGRLLPRLSVTCYA